MPSVCHGRDHAVQLVLATRHNDDMGTGLGKGDGAAKPDAGRAAGHKRAAALKGE